VASSLVREQREKQGAKDRKKEGSDRSVVRQRGRKKRETGEIRCEVITLNVSFNVREREWLVIFCGTPT
jgi:hypothetical protein